MLKQEDLKWFAARTRNAQALHVRTLLQQLQVEYFIPTTLKMVERNNRRQTKEVPLLSNLIFIHATKRHACSLANEIGIPIFYIIDQITRSLLIVPDKQMQNFMQVVDLSPESISMSELPLKKGCKVKVMKGDFAGVEGEMLGMATRTYVIIRIGDMMAAKIKVPKGYLVAVE